MKQAYKTINMRGEALALIERINVIIDTYQRQGFILSVRQLYYQLVARAEIENTEKSYKRIASIINDGRLAGLIDWDAIEDRNRDIETKTRWRSAAQIITAAADGFHMDMWETQADRVLVIVEKAALSGVLGRVCTTYDVPLLAARGYPSVSIVREMALQHIAPAIREGQTVKVLHLGDHDPSGIDMSRDLDERLRLFMPGCYRLSLERIALNMPQIRELNPPPNPAKTTDSRFLDYQQKFGNDSWELDALNPAYLETLVENEIKACIDEGAWSEREEEIEGIRDSLLATAREYDERAE